MQLSAIPARARRHWKLLALVAAFGGLAVAGLMIRHQQNADELAADEQEGLVGTPPPPSQIDPGQPAVSPRQARSAQKSRKVYATWYPVPENSLAKRRAGSDELTAAHDRLPLGTLVRVTHLKNGKSVVVRITDRGIHKRKVKLDLCKEAAEQLEMVRQGMARVRMEVLPEEHGATPPETQTAAPQP